MSRVRSSKARFAGVVAAALCAASLCACSRPVDVHSEQVRGVGYVRMDDVVKSHPLYGQLAQIDNNIDALGLRALAPAVPLTGAELTRQTNELNQQLENARQRANKVLQQKQGEYAQREQAAIRAAIVAAGEDPGAAPGQSISNTAAQQAASVSAQANSDFQQYQQSVIAQDRTAVGALEQQLSARAERQYRAKSDELSAKESQVSLELSTKNSGQRLALRTKLNNLALDDATRAQTKAQLSALDRQEAQAIAAMRARDAATLAAYQRQLRAQTQAEIGRQAQSIHAQTNAKLKARQSTLGSQVNAQIGALGAAAPGARLSPGTQAKIAQIDKQYKAQFAADVKKTIAEFNTTRSDLDLRFQTLRGVNSASAGSVSKQLGELHKQRDQLYNQIVAQIKREIKTIASQRGLTIVFDTPVAPAGGIDLTADVQKDVESLHE